MLRRRDERDRLHGAVTAGCAATQPRRRAVRDGRQGARYPQCHHAVVFALSLNHLDHLDGKLELP